MHGKKALAIEQVFVFILAALTFVLIFIFGYRAIAGFVESGEQVEFVQFKSDLERTVKRIYTEYGSVRKEEFSAPPKYNQICWVDVDEDYDLRLCEKDALACDVWADASQKPRPERYESVESNVFLKPSAPVPIKVYRISIDPREGRDFLCLPLSNGRFSLLLEGKGDRTMLSIVS